MAPATLTGRWLRRLAVHQGYAAAGEEFEIGALGHVPRLIPVVEIRPNHANAKQNSSVALKSFVDRIYPAD